MNDEIWINEYVGGIGRTCYSTKEEARRSQRNHDKLLACRRFVRAEVEK